MAANRDRFIGRIASRRDSGHGGYARNRWGPSITRWLQPAAANQSPRSQPARENGRNVTSVFCDETTWGGQHDAIFRIGHDRPGVATCRHVSAGSTGYPIHVTWVTASFGRVPLVVGCRRTSRPRSARSHARDSGGEKTRSALIFVALRSQTSRPAAAMAAAEGQRSTQYKLGVFMLNRFLAIALLLVPTQLGAAPTPTRRLETLAGTLRRVQDDDLRSGPIPRRAQIRCRTSTRSRAVRLGFAQSRCGVSPFGCRGAGSARELQSAVRADVPDTASGPYAETVDLRLEAISDTTEVVVAAITISIKCGANTSLHILARVNTHWRNIGTIGPLPSSIANAWGRLEYAASHLARPGRFCWCWEM